MATQTTSMYAHQAPKISTPAKPSQSNHDPISKVRVIIRVRPFLPIEIAANKGNPVPCVSVLEPELDSCDEVTVHIKDQYTSRNECYKLDSFFGQQDNNLSEIFYREVSPLIPGIFSGCNATVFAYGATGSGKTYTMQGSDELPGLMPLTMSTVLSMSMSTGSTTEISYYEVYMDRCYDLLELKAKEISVLDDKDGQIHLKGLSRVPVKSMFEFHDVFSYGIQRRKVAHTGLNDVSSRSHGVLVVLVSTPCGDIPGTAITGKLNLIDLAGNEDNRRTCNEGIRLQESAKINQSLFALSKVIYALNNNETRVPYRESKLTRILQDSLGGTSSALMVACLNPGEYQESVHTVSLAARSRHISNFVSPAQKSCTPKVKIDMEAKLRAWLESKGKTKNAQRFGVFGSPFLSQTPNSVSSVKKLGVYQSSAKKKANTNQGASNEKERAVSVSRKNLFKNGNPIVTHLESVGTFMYQDMRISKAEECAIISEDGSLSYSSGAQSRDRVQFHSSKISELAAGESVEKAIMVTAEGVESKTSTPDGLIETAVKMSNIKSADSIGLSPICDKIRALKSSLRKALSPINANRNIENLSSRDQICVVLFDAKTPKTPFIMTDANKFQNVGTPLDKLNAKSSNLKTSLVQEYIDFLNTASREELLELKGIGQKMAEYIVVLRETSPLKSLSDLGKIGLSSKQVQNMFGRAARGLFA